MQSLPNFDAIVLAGGGARRMGGVDKPGLDIGGETLLGRALSAVAAAGRIVVVGPARAVSYDVVWCLENPPGGGPVAGVAAGAMHVGADFVVVIAADLPAIAPAVPVLLSAALDADCAVLKDDSGRVNYLASAWRSASLRTALNSLDTVDGAAMRALVASARMIEVPDSGGWGTDCDTWEDLEAARRREPGRAP